MDGQIYVVREDNLAVESRFDLSRMEAPAAPGGGWCRGVLPVDGERVWVGFTRIRPTRWKEKVRWIKNMVSGVCPPTRLVLYDLARSQCLDSVNLEPLGLHAVFNAVPVAA